MKKIWWYFIVCVCLVSIVAIATYIITTKDERIYQAVEALQNDNYIFADKLLADVLSDNPENRDAQALFLLLKLYSCTEGNSQADMERRLDRLIDLSDFPMIIASYERRAVHKMNPEVYEEKIGSKKAEWLRKINELGVFVNTMEDFQEIVNTFLSYKASFTDDEIVQGNLLDLNKNIYDFVEAFNGSSDAAYSLCRKVQRHSRIADVLFYLSDKLEYHPKFSYINIFSENKPVAIAISLTNAIWRYIADNYSCLNKDQNIIDAINELYPKEEHLYSIYLNRNYGNIVDKLIPYHKQLFSINISIKAINDGSALLHFYRYSNKRKQFITTPVLAMNGMYYRFLIDGKDNEFVSTVRPIIFDNNSTYASEVFYGSIYYETEEYYVDEYFYNPEKYYNGDRYIGGYETRQKMKKRDVLRREYVAYSIDIDNRTINKVD